MKTTALKVSCLTSAVIALSVIYFYRASDTAAPINSGETSVQAIVVTAPEYIDDKKVEQTGEKEHTVETEKIDIDMEMPDKLKALIASAQPEKSMAYFSEQRRHRAKLLQQTMAVEGVDHEWEQEVVQLFAISKSIAPQASYLKIQDVDCRETICAIAMDYIKPLEYPKIKPFIDTVGNILGRDMFMHHDARAHGGVMYLSREEAELPEVDAS